MEIVKLVLPISRCEKVRVRSRKKKRNEFNKMDKFIIPITLSSQVLFVRKKRKAFKWGMKENFSKNIAIINFFSNINFIWNKLLF